MEILADDVIIIAGGKLVRQGTMATIVSGLATAERVRVRTPQPQELLKALGSEVTTETGADGALLVTGASAPEVGAAALRASVELHELVAEKPDLEHVFLELTAGKAGIR